MRGARLILAIGLVFTVVMTGAWVIPNGAPTALTPPTDVPDPASVGTSHSGYDSQIYGTGGATTQTNIFEESWVPGTYYVFNSTDAVPFLYSDMKPQVDFAPTVRLIAGQYVMWFTGGNINRAIPNRLYTAVSYTSARGPFYIVGEYQDPISASVGLFDPSLWVEPDGSDWLIWSREEGAVTNEIVSARLNPEGTSFAVGISATFTLATFADLPIYPYNSGTNPQIENPALTVEPQPYTDQYGYYIRNDLYVSAGTYNQNNAYNTYEMGCAAVYGPCDSSSAININSSIVGGNNPLGLENPGGASFNEGDFNAERYLLFAADRGNPTGVRGLYFDPTYLPSIIDQPALLSYQSLTADQYLYNVTTGWGLSMVNNGNLVLYDNNHSPRWATNTAGDIMTYAIIQADGNLVIFDNGRVLWNAQTDGSDGAVLVLQNDDSLVIRSATGQVIKYLFIP